MRQIPRSGATHPQWHGIDRLTPGYTCVVVRFELPADGRQEGIHYASADRHGDVVLATLLPAGTACIKWGGFWHGPRSSTFLGKRRPLFVLAERLLLLCDPPPRIALGSWSVQVNLANNDIRYWTESQTSRSSADHQRQLNAIIRNLRGATSMTFLTVMPCGHG